MEDLLGLQQDLPRAVRAGMTIPLQTRLDYLDPLHPLVSGLTGATEKQRDDAAFLHPCIISELVYSPIQSQFRGADITMFR